MEKRAAVYDCICIYRSICDRGWFLCGQKCRRCRTGSHQYGLSAVSYTHLEAITPWPVLGAAALGSIGISFLYHPRRDYRNYGCWGRGNHYSTETEETVDGSQMEFSTSFAGSIKYVNSDDFQSADLKCSFGSLKAVSYTHLGICNYFRAVQPKEANEGR